MATLPKCEVEFCGQFEVFEDGFLGCPTLEALLVFSSKKIQIWKVLPLWHWLKSNDDLLESFWQMFLIRLFQLQHF